MFLSTVLLASAITIQADSLLPTVLITSMKEPLTSGVTAHGKSSIYQEEMERLGMDSPKELSLVMPGLYIPDYGSSMTSTIYHRGFGSRMENPVMGLYIDDIPVPDKNCYDTDFIDVRSVELMNGPQGTLYGRNSMSGLMNIRTLSPDVFQGYRANVEYGTAGSIRAKGSVYRNSIGAAAWYTHTDGFYENTYSGRKCDSGDGAGLRLRYMKTPTGKKHLENIFSASYTDQGGYPYRQITGSGVQPVCYNDLSGYSRLHISEGFKLGIIAGGVRINSVTSLSYLYDRMDMDQDFTSASMFTLMQKQNSLFLTQEATITPAVQKEHWKTRNGIFIYARMNDMEAPVTFKSDGIRTLILDNANANIPSYLGQLSFLENEFPITSDFDMLYANAAIYHESVFVFDRWQIVAGLRIDAESAVMDYNSQSNVNFILSPAMSDYHSMDVRYQGNETESSFQLLPKLAVMHDFRSEMIRGRVEASYSRGYRAGGFNTQIFSDILQNIMMNQMMGLCGVHLDNSNSTSAAATVYKPEFADDFEIGLTVTRPGDVSFTGSVTAFHIECRDQQITVFPPGKSTGRMMANAGHSKSTGFEADLSMSAKDMTVAVSYGYSNARFSDYSDGNNDYSGKRIPYAPLQTLSARAGYTYRKWTLNAMLTGLGDIWWDQANTLRQPFYLTGRGRLTYNMTETLTLYLSAENITDKERPVFYFKSVGNSFFQMSKPAYISLGLNLLLYN